MRVRGWMFVLLVLLVLPMIIATHPFITNPEVEVAGLQITFPLLEFYPDNENITFNFHIFNATNFPIEDATVDCSLHIYSNSGDHVLIEDLVLDTDDGDYQYVTNTSILSRGEYSYLVHCNSTTLQEAGFVSSTIEITHDGLSSDVRNSSLPLILGIIAIIIVFIIIGLMLNNIYLKLIALIMVLGADIILWATMMKVAEDILRLTAITNLMSAGWPYIMYSHVVFIGLILLFLVYELFMLLSRVNEAKYKKR